MEVVTSKSASLMGQAQPKNRWAAVKSFVEGLQQRMEPHPDVQLIEAVSDYITLVCWPDRVKDALDKGADPNYQGGCCWTPLMHAIKNDNIAAVKILLERGADPNAGIGDYNFSASQWAEHITFDKKIIELLRRYEKLSKRKKDTPASTKKTDTQLPTEGTREKQNHVNLMSEVNSFLLSPLPSDNKSQPHVAAPTRRQQLGHSEQVTVKSFVEKIQSGKARTAEEQLRQQQANRNALLVCAAAIGDLDAVKRMLWEGANIDTTRDGQTALTEAIKGNHKEVVELLLKHGTDKTGEQRNTALVYAARMGNTVVELAVEVGASVNATDRWGTPVLSLAMRAPDFSYIDVLSTMNFLIEKDANVNARNNDGETVLHDAVGSAHRNRMKFMELLIENGANVNEEGYHGQTPLMRAAKDGCPTGIIKLLIRNGAEVNAEDDDGETALALAVRGDHKEVAELLRQYGAQY